jgi:hypothetical protein
MDFYVKREEQEQAEEAQRKREAEARAAQERYRREEESRRQADQQRTEELRRGRGAGQAQPSPPRSRRGVLVGLGVLGAVVVVGLIAAVTYSFLPRGATMETPQPASPPGANVDRFVGLWTNENPQTGGITRVEIQSRLNKLNIQMWGQCHPTDCDWGTESTDRSDSDDGTLSITWDSGFDVVTQRLTTPSDGRLQIVSHTHFTDNSERPDYGATEYFTRTTGEAKPTTEEPKSETAHVKAKSPASPGSQNSSSDHQNQVSETALRQAIEDYYKAVARRDWGYTYSHLDSETQSAFTRDEWFAKNEWLADAATVTYTIQSVDMDSSSPESVANVAVLLTYADGSTSTRTTYFVYEDGVWKHRFGAQEYELFANAQSASASANSSSSSSASEPCEPSALAARQWEGWVAPSDPFGHPPCMNKEGTYRSYIPLFGGIDDMQNYLNAAEAGDYDAMYNMLAPPDQQHYTLNEWRQANDAIGTDQSTYKLADTLVVSDERGASTAGQAIVKITVPTGKTVTKYWWFGPASEGGPWLHWLNDEEIKLLDEATPASGEQGSSYDQTAGSSVREEAGVANAIRGHYQAIGAGDFAKAYSYFGPTVRSQLQNNKQGWINSEESSQITGSTINSLKVPNVSGNQATATVDVSIQDKSGTSRFQITWQLVKEDGRWKLDKQVSGKRIS